MKENGSSLKEKNISSAFFLRELGAIESYYNIKTRTNKLLRMFK